MVSYISCVVITCVGSFIAGCVSVTELNLKKGLQIKALILYCAIHFGEGGCCFCLASFRVDFLNIIFFRNLFSAF